jgi:hypothetical protein
MNSMKKGVIFLAMMAALLGGCCGGGSTTVKPTTTTTTVTLGQQLLDLQKAYDSGVITKEQYEKMKRDIIDKSSK